MKSELIMKLAEAMEDLGRDDDMADEKAEWSDVQTPKDDDSMAYWDDLDFNNTKH